MSEIDIKLQKASLTLQSRVGPVKILRDIDLTLNSGQSVAVVGPSGSGKSSLLMVLAGLEKPTSGKCQTLGHDLSVLDEDSLAEMRLGKIGIVFQSFHLIPTLCAIENVALPLELMGVSDAFAHARAELDSVGLGDRLQHYSSQLSGGEQQRVALARALVTRPHILFADEPTGNLDRKTGSMVVDLMFDRVKQVGASLILVTHDPKLAARCSRQLRLENGRLIDDKSKAGK